MCIESVMPSSHLILCCPLLLLPPILPSFRVFPNESTLRMRWPKYWSFSFSISPSNEHPGLVSFRMDWLGLLAVQGTLKNLLQHHSSKASVLRCSAFFMVQPVTEHPRLYPSESLPEASPPLAVSSESPSLHRHTPQGNVRPHEGRPWVPSAVSEVPSGVAAPPTLRTAS